jgi:capsular exopolysaccharide synthesis family protein
MSATEVKAGGAVDRLGALRRHWWIVALCGVIVPVAAWAFSATATKQWTATAQLLFRDPGFDQKLFGSSYLSPSKDPSREAATNVKLVGLATVFDRSAERLGPPRTARQLAEQVNVSSQGQSDVVAVSATDHDPRFAAKLADVVAGEYIAFRREADRSVILQGLEPVERELGNLTAAERDGAQGRSLVSRAEELRMFSSLQTGNAELVQPALVPSEPSSPRTTRNVVLGLVLGLGLGILLALLAERLDTRLRDRGEVESLLGRPILAEVPQSVELQNGVNVASSLHGADIEAFRTLRVGLRYLNHGPQIRSLVVTSAVAGEGKSTIALNLALSSALSGTRTILLEADLRRPNLSYALNLHDHTGLTSVLLGDADLDDVIQRYEVTERVGACDLEVITAGGTPPNPSALLGSAKMLEILDELTQRCEQLIIDTPPVAVVSDAVPIIERSSGMIVVVRRTSSTRSSVRELRRRLDNFGITPLGIVLNSTQVDAGQYGGYYGPPATPPRVDGANNSNGKQILQQRA